MQLPSHVVVCADGTGTAFDPNRELPLQRAINGEIELAFLIDVALRSTRSRLEDVERWMGDEHQHQDEHGHAHRHDSAVKSFCIRYDKPFTWTSFSQCMEVLATLRGPDLFRVKGLVNVTGHKGPLIVQGVQHLFHPPIELEAWPTADQQTRIVFITRGISEDMIRNLFAAITSVAAAAA